MFNFIDPEALQEYWLREGRYDELSGTKEPEPYEYGRGDLDQTLLQTPGASATEIPGEWDQGWKGLAKQGAGMLPGGSAVGIVATIAGMIGRKKAEEEEEKEMEKREALRRAAFMSQNRARAVGRWGY